MPDTINPDVSDGWGAWRRHVLMQMEEHTQKLEKISTELTTLKTEVALLKYKSSVWGAAGAALVVALYFLIQILQKGSQ